MEREQLKSLLSELGVRGDKFGRYPDSGENIQMCCPFHEETRPSCGIHVDDECGKCFVCDTRFNLAKIVAHQMGFTYPSGEDDISRGYRWLEERFGVQKKTFNKENLVFREYEDRGVSVDESKYRGEDGRFSLPKKFIAPFRGGVSVHEYFLNRGFTKETAKKFLIGWDRVLHRVTIPIFYEDGTLFGVIGRAVLNPKTKSGKPSKEYGKVYKGYNFARYFIYEKAPIGEILFPLNYFKLDKDKKALLVEGQLDSIWLHQMGFQNALSSITSKLTVEKSTGYCKQAEILKSLGVKEVVLFRDNDEAGEKGVEHDSLILKKDFKVSTVKYPKGKHDPQELTKKEVNEMLRNRRSLLKRKLRRIE